MRHQTRTWGHREGRRITLKTWRARGRQAGFALAVLAGLATGIGCQTRPNGAVVRGTPPVELGLSDLQFVQSDVLAGPQIRLHRVVPIPFESWSWRRSALDGDPVGADIPALSLNPVGAEPPLFVRYSSSIVDLAHQQEVMLFVRDPEEAFETFKGNLRDAGTWKLQAAATTCRRR
jgi:hypothetical protein